MKINWTWLFIGLAIGIAIMLGMNYMNAKKAEKKAAEDKRLADVNAAAAAAAALAKSTPPPPVFDDADLDADGNPIA